MIDAKQDINEIANQLILIYKNNPLITEDVLNIYKYGIDVMHQEVIRYLDRKVVLTKGEVVEMFEALSNCIDSVHDEAEDYNLGIEKAQDIIHGYLT